MPGKSNGALLEWLHSPVVYRAETGFLDRWRAAARQVFSPRYSANHYRGLAKQMIRGKLDGPEVRAKDYLYALRAILAATWIERTGDIAPVEFSRLPGLLPEPVRGVLPELLEWKARTGEKHRMGRVGLLDDYLRRRLTELEASVDSLPVAGDVSGPLEELVRSPLRHGGPVRSADFTQGQKGTDANGASLRARPGIFSEKVPSGIVPPG